VLLSVAESKGLQSDLIPRIATGLCGGISRTNNICGAVSGAVLAINLFYGRMTPDASTEENYARVQEMIEAFEHRFGTCDCRELIGCDLSTRQGQASFKKQNLIARCRKLTAAATEMVMKII